jgi:signal transduction histidine kinase
VSDNGCGIKKEILSNVFDLYKTRDFSMPLSGLGLGLPLVKKLVELHKGQISIESTEGLGTTVFISIPYENNKKIE